MVSLICAVNFAWELTERGGNTLSREKAMTNAVTHTVLEELFVCSAIGSPKIPWARLEALYKRHDVFEADEVIAIHVQEFSK